jgi:hypothetical protein
MTDKLTTNEAAQLKRCETIIQSSKSAAYAFAEALREIRDSRLYRQDYSSFDAYLAERWKITRGRANQEIRRMETMKALPESVSSMVTNERTAREVAKVPKEQREAVIKRAAAKGKVTGKTIREALKSEKESVEEFVLHDSDGVEVPKKLRELWLRGGEMAEVLNQLSKIKSILKQAQENDDPLWRHVVHAAAAADLSRVWTSISGAKPYAVCPQCQGHPEVQKCGLCLNTGIIGRFKYKAVDEKLLALRKKALAKSKKS